MLLVSKTSGGHENMDLQHAGDYNENYSKLTHSSHLMKIFKKRWTEKWEE